MSAIKVPTSTPEQLTRLKTLLQGITPSAFERVVAAFVSEFLGIGITVAKSGFQHGADMGPSGRLGRRFRIETKRYADETRLSDRELRGEIDDALDADPALEAWFLAATREAPEQLERAFLKQSDRLGVPVVVIDWKADTFPALAALCTSGPGVLDTMVSQEAGDLARALTADAASARNQLKREMEAWNLGFERLRNLSQDYLRKVWTDRGMAVAVLGQDVAGGATATTITRTALHEALDAWWVETAAEGVSAVILGHQGVGKTWAAVHWLIDRVDQQPILVVVPSGKAAGLVDTSLAGVKRFLGDRLQDITQSADQTQWRLRLERLLKRPVSEGPVLTLVFDGLNQEPRVHWPDLLRTLHHPELLGRVRVISITRHLHFTEKLKHLRGLLLKPRKVEIGPYDDTPGGEFDQRLALEGLTRDDLHPDLIEFARTPRLFSWSHRVATSEA